MGWAAALEEEVLLSLSSPPPADLGVGATGPQQRRGPCHRHPAQRCEAAKGHPVRVNIARVASRCSVMRPFVVRRRRCRPRCIATLVVCHFCLCPWTLSTARGATARAACPTPSHRARDLLGKQLPLPMNRCAMRLQAGRENRLGVQSTAISSKRFPCGDSTRSVREPAHRSRASLGASGPSWE